jgi:hypothetical protein
MQPSLQSQQFMFAESVSCKSFNSLLGAATGRLFNLHSLPSSCNSYNSLLGTTTGRLFTHEQLRIFQYFTGCCCKKDIRSQTAATFNSWLGAATGRLLAHKRLQFCEQLTECCYRKAIRSQRAAIVSTADQVLPQEGYSLTNSCNYFNSWLSAAAGRLFTHKQQQLFQQLTRCCHRNAIRSQTAAIISIADSVLLQEGYSLTKSCSSFKNWLGAGIGRLFAYKQLQFFQQLTGCFYRKAIHSLTPTLNLFTPWVQLDERKLQKITSEHLNNIGQLN